MENIPTPIQTTVQPVQQPANSTTNPTPQFIPESKSKIIIKRILLILKRIAWSGGILFYAFQYYTNFKMCQETGRIALHPLVVSSCTFSDQLFYPLKGTFLLITVGHFISWSLFILFVVFLFKSKDQKAYLLRIFFTINAILFFLFISLMLSLMRIDIWPFLFSGVFTLVLLLLPIVSMLIRIIYALIKQERRPRKNYWTGIVLILLVGSVPIIAVGSTVPSPFGLIPLAYIIVFCTLIYISGELGI